MKKLNVVAIILVAVFALSSCGGAKNTVEGLQYVKRKILNKDNKLKEAFTMTVEAYGAEYNEKKSAEKSARKNASIRLANTIRLLLKETYKETSITTGSKEVETGTIDEIETFLNLMASHIKPGKATFTEKDGFYTFIAEAYITVEEFDELITKNPIDKNINGN